MPEGAWRQDAERRTRAGVPGHSAFATKPALAGQMIAAALEADISASWVTGDEAYRPRPHSGRPAGSAWAGLRSGRGLLRPGADQPGPGPQID
ncbi:transposase [Streptomyces mirabilis]|uniref:transposase n=1 Tax=Streptomyces mirabilis TaxID=68239 RepID=UPI00371E3B82